MKYEELYFDYPQTCADCLCYIQRETLAMWIDDGTEDGKVSCVQCFDGLEGAA